MSIFKKTKEQEKQFEKVINDLQNINDKLQKYENYEVDFSNITKIKQNFEHKINDFYRDDRKLNIAIIGQVKAGKSSFLNTLLFEGNEILPKAVTPKTASLTKIEYSETNKIEVEFYNNDEWKILEQQSKSDSKTTEIQVAKEIMKLIQQNNVNPSDYLGQSNYTVEFSSYDELKKDLNDYVGENGKYTPLVKSVTLKINNDYLKEISIVDTPGLNDPVASRTDKTKQFIEMCDVVFFLSKADRFLDKSDVELLTCQLPQKGVKKLVLICSKYDAGLLSVIYDTDDLDEAKVEVKRSLKKQAKKVFEKVINDYSHKGQEFISVVESCKEPIFVSSMAHNMSKKEISEFDKNEKIVYEGLNIDGDVNKEVLENIGNFKKVNEIFNDVVKNKEETLLKKSNDFIPTVKLEVNEEIKNLVNLVSKRNQILKTEDKNQLQNKKKFIQNQINIIASTLESIFGEMFIKLENNKVECVKDLRVASREYSTLSEKTGVKYNYIKNTVSTSVWYKPSTWGTSKTELLSYEETYTYIDSADAIENIRNYAFESANQIEDTFNKSIEIHDLKRSLLNIIIDEFDTSDENYDPIYFKLIVEKSLNSIELPVIKINVDDFVSKISSRFSGEVTDSYQKNEIKKLTLETISDLFDFVSNKFESEIKTYKQKLESMKSEFNEVLLKNINEEFDVISKQFDDKENQIKRNEELLNIFDEISNYI